MKVEQRIGYGESELQVGMSTWDGAERSARVAHKNRNGGFNPKSPETPMDALFELFMLALDNDEFTREQMERLRNRLR